MPKKPLRGNILISTVNPRPLTVEHLMKSEFLTPMKGALVAIIVLIVFLLVHS